MKRHILSIIALIGLTVTAAALFLPWNAIIESRLHAYLASRGIIDISFDVGAVSFHEATLNNVRLGKENPLQLRTLTVAYDPGELLHGQLQDLTVTGLDVYIVETGGKWAIGGMDASSPSSTDNVPPSLTSLIDKIPFSAIHITDSMLHIVGNSLAADAPFNAVLSKVPDRSISLTLQPATVKVGGNYSVGVVSAHLKPDTSHPENWNGTWSMASLSAEAGDLFPTLSGQGTLSYTNEDLRAEGTLTSVDKSYSAHLRADYTRARNGARAVTVTSLSFPFKEGTISAKNITIPIGPREDIILPLTIREVSVDALLRTLTGQRVNATGTVSGNVPVILKKDGSFSLGKGSLTADRPGTIQMSADAIPGDNEQVDLVREILQNLNYSLLSAAVDTGGEQGIVVRLSLEGHNPAVYGGHPVKLNVNLTGDVLDFIQQNAMLLTKPETLLKRKTR